MRQARRVGTYVVFGISAVFGGCASPLEGPTGTSTAAQVSRTPDDQEDCSPRTGCVEEGRTMRGEGPEIYDEGGEEIGGVPPAGHRRMGGFGGGRIPRTPDGGYGPMIPGDYGPGNVCEPGGDCLVRPPGPPRGLVGD
jgi:hypothetical protein